MGDVGEQFKVIFDDPEFQKFKNFMTLEIVNGELVVTNSTYIGTDGKYYSSNPYDQKDLKNKPISTRNVSGSKVNGGSVYVLDGDSIKKVTIDEYKVQFPDDSTRLVEIKPGEFVRNDQYAQINQMAMSAAQKANSKNPAPPNGKVQIVPVNAIENTRETGTPTSGSGSDPT